MIVAFAYLVLVSAHWTDAADQTVQPTNSKAENNEKIHIIADTLVSESESNSFEFIGNVKATQGDAFITADRLKVFYDKNTDKKNQPLAGEQSIKKIIAKGRVIIKFDDRIATTEQAVYTTETKILVLSGQNSKITRGNDTISGETITLYRADERIKVESGEEKRVEAVFYTGDQGIN